MDFEEIRIPYGHKDEHIECYLHPSPSRTLIILVHGHNSNANNPMFMRLAAKLHAGGYAVLRYSALRERVGDFAHLVTTVEEEVRQLHVVIEAFRHEFDQIIVAGHSQGGIIALQGALDSDLDGVVFLMSVMEPQLHIDSKLQRIGITRDELQRKKHFTYESRTQGTTFVYTPAFFDDLELWDMPAMLTQWYKPSLFVGGTKDEMVSLEEVERGFSIANEPKELLTVEDGHNFGRETADKIAEKMLSWIKEQGLAGGEDADPY